MRDDSEAIKLREEHQMWMKRASESKESLEEAEILARVTGWIGRLLVWLGTFAHELSLEQEELARVKARKTYEPDR